MIERIGFVGGGVMAEAIIRGLLGRQVVAPEQIAASDVLAERRDWLATEYGIRTMADNRQVVRETPIVVLAVKPQQMPEVFAGLRGRLAPDQLVVSVAAGVAMTSVANGIEHNRIVRVMPNTPAQIGAGMSVWTATEAVAPAQREQVQTLLRTLGREVYVADESYLDMATAINGSGPAYVFLFVEALVDAAVHLGLARPLAEALVFQTVVGAALMAQSSGKHPAQLKNLVTSPGGTTAAGLAALEDGRFRALVDRAVVAAYERSKELGR
jgi:pyrroline-5-carboxylate reductase